MGVGVGVLANDNLCKILVIFTLAIQAMKKEGSEVEPRGTEWSR